MRRHTVVLTVALCLAWASELPAQSPEAIARAVLRADSVGDWAALLRVAHPDALAEFRAVRVFQLRMLSGADWPGSDFMERGLDSLQRAHLAQAQARNLRTLLDSVYQVPTADSLAHLLPDSVFARTIRFQHHWPTAANAQAAMLPSWKSRYRIIGTVSASDTLAYVVIERALPRPPTAMPEPFSHLPQHDTDAEVMTIRRFRGQWRSMLNVGVSASGGFVLDLEHEDSTTDSPQRQPN